jgi:pimeloyl-ACP methyl ester carboxylesterase
MKAVLISFAVIVSVLAVFVAVFVAANWAPERAVSDLQTRWAQPPSQFVEADGMRVHVRDEGPKDAQSPIVLLHGTGSSLQAWDGWAAALKGRWRVIRLDLPGFGLTGPSPDRIYSINKDIGVVFAVLDKLGVSSCVLGGNSLGGAIAWRAALSHPDRVEKLILVDAGGYPTQAISVPIGFKLARLPGISWLLSNTLPRFLVVQGFRNVFGDPSRVTPEMVDRSVELTQREGNRRALLDRFHQGRPGAFADRIKELKVPSLIMWGGKDRLIPPGNATRFHNDIVGSTLVVFDDLGHAPEEEDPQRTVQAVKAFLSAP